MFQHISLFTCAIWLSHVLRQTCTDSHADRCCAWYWLYGEQLFVGLCWVVAVAFFSLTTGRGIGHRQAHIEGSCKLPLKGLKTNGIHPHRCQHKIQPFGLRVKWTCPLLHTPKSKKIGSKPVTALLELWSTSLTTCQKELLLHNCCAKCLPKPVSKLHNSHELQHQTPSHLLSWLSLAS